MEQPNEMGYVLQGMYDVHFDQMHCLASSRNSSEHAKEKQIHAGNT